MYHMHTYIYIYRHKYISKYTYLYIQIKWLQTADTSTDGSTMKNHQLGAPHPFCPDGTRNSLL